MLASGNLLKPSDGEPVTVPTQDMILGSYYLTLVNPDDKGHGKIFRDEDEAMMAYSEGLSRCRHPSRCAARWSLTASRRPAWSIPRWARSSSTPPSRRIWLRGPHQSRHQVRLRDEPPHPQDCIRRQERQADEEGPARHHQPLPDQAWHQDLRHDAGSDQGSGYKYSTCLPSPSLFPMLLCLTRSRQFWLPPIRRSKRS